MTQDCDEVARIIINSYFAVQKIQEDPGEGMEALEDAFLGAEQQLCTQAPGAFRRRVQPGALCRDADETKQVVAQRLRRLDVDSNSGDPIGTGHRRGTDPAAVSEAPDHAGGPDRRAVLSREEREVSDFQIGQRPAGAKPSLGELAAARRHGSRDAGGLFRIEERRVHFLGELADPDLGG